MLSGDIQRSSEPSLDGTPSVNKPIESVVRERRKDPRYQPSTDSEEISASITLGDGNTSLGKVLDVSLGGVAIGFPMGASPILPLGWDVNLTLEMRRRGHPITLLSRVKDRTEQDNIRRFGFEFLDRVQVLERFEQVLPMLMNRRQDYRVQLGHNEQICAMLSPRQEGFGVAGYISNISASGLRLIMPPAVETRFAGLTDVKVTMKLPNQHDALSLAGCIGNRKLGDDCVYYGIRFDDPGDAAPDHDREVIRQFTMEQQRKELQRMKNLANQKQAKKEPAT